MAVGALAGPRVPFYVAAAIAGVNALVAIRRLPETHGRAAGCPWPRRPAVERVRTPR